MHSYILTGLRMGPFIRLLRQHGFSPTPRNIGRVLFIMQNAFWASFHTWREKKLYDRLGMDNTVPDNPVIIIGHWRTGSTLLHLLLSQDRQLVTPSLFQVTFPECFLAAERYFRPIIGMMVRKRPMDNVKLGFDDPQEDEFAQLKLTLDSPLLDLVFPRQPGYFIDHYEDFNPLPEHREIWKEKITDFCNRVDGGSGRTILLKNPAHSLRIPLLCETFPGARFIHIHRHPYKVAASSMHLWKVMADDNQLRGKPAYPNLEEVTEGMKKFYRVIERDGGALPENRFCEVRYEYLEADPIKEIKRIYARFNIDFTPEFAERIGFFQNSTKDFIKNSYTFDDREKEVVFLQMEEIFNKYHYERRA